jgi:hypothetical protein
MSTCHKCDLNPVSQFATSIGKDSKREMPYYEIPIKFCTCT